MRLVESGRCLGLSAEPSLEDRIDQVLQVEFPDDVVDLNDFEVVEEYKPYREWCVPAALINEHATVTLMSADDVDGVAARRWRDRTAGQ